MKQTFTLIAAALALGAGSTALHAQGGGVAGSIGGAVNGTVGPPVTAGGNTRADMGADVGVRPSPETVMERVESTSDNANERAMERVESATDRATEALEDNAERAEDRLEEDFDAEVGASANTPPANANPNAHVHAGGAVDSDPDD